MATIAAKTFFAMSLFSSMFAINLQTTVAVCDAEQTACQADTACAACINGANSSQACGTNDTITCADHAADCCTAYGESCSDNSLLLSYANCTVAQFNDSCNIDSLCNFVGDDDDGGGGSDDESPCPVEEQACLDDTDCLACYDAAGESGCGENNGTTCQAFADSYCCAVGGGTCSTNALMKTFVSCLVDNNTNDECGVDEQSDFCAYSEEEAVEDDDDRSVGDSEENPCPVEEQACLDDTDCLACYDAAGESGCGENNGTTCQAFADSYCCAVGGGTCSTNALMKTFVSCLVDNNTNNECGVDEQSDFCAYSEEEAMAVDCEEELDACRDNSVCNECMDAADDMGDDQCPTAGTTCQAQAEAFCCMYANSSASCGTNTLLLEYTGCMTELVVDDCETTDLCFSGAAGFFTRSGTSIFVAAAAVATLLALAVETFVV